MQSYPRCGVFVAMPDSNKPEEPAQIDRRQLLQGALGVGIAAGLGAVSAQLTAAESDAITKSVSEGSSSIQSENAKPGTPDWQLTYTRIDPTTLYRSPWIEGFVSKASVKAGDLLELFVSTRPV